MAKHEVRLLRVCSRKDEKAGLVRAYLALPDTMEGAREVATLSIVEAQHERVFEAWVQLLEAIGGAVQEEVAGSWPSHFNREKPREAEA